MAQATVEHFVKALGLTGPLPDQLARLPGQVTGLAMSPQDKRLTVSLQTGQPLAARDLCDLEAFLEEGLGLAQVLVRQAFPQTLTGELASTYVSTLKAWLMRHLWRRDALVASLLQDASLSAEGDQVVLSVADASRHVLTHGHMQALEAWLAQHLDAAVSWCLRANSTDAACLFTYARQLSQHHQKRANQAHENDKDRRPPPQASRPPAAAEAARARTPALWGRIQAKLKRVAIQALNSETGLALIEGQVFGLESRSVSDGTRLLIKFNLTDRTSSIACLLFVRPDEGERLLQQLTEDAMMRAAVEISFDAQYTKDLQARVLGLQAAPAWPDRSDDSPLKRVELHAHTKMSARDAVCDTGQLIRRAAAFGHTALAITDHGVVQAFPEAAETCAALNRQGQPFKVLYGLEGYLVDDGDPVTWACEGASLDQGFIALDVETTGLNPARDRLIEVAAVRFKPDGQGGFVAGERFSQLINPGQPVPAKITELTGIDSQMVADAPDALSVLRDLSVFLADLPLVGHNVFFDVGFLRYEGTRTPGKTDPTLKFNQPLIDTLPLARLLLPHLKRHRLGLVAADLAVDLDQAHRALADALATGQVFSRLWQTSGAADLQALNQLAGSPSIDDEAGHKLPVHHVILIAKDLLGLYHLYRIVSASHLSHFYYRPRIPKSLLTYFRHGLIVGSACERGEIYQAALQAYRERGSLDQALKDLASPQGRRLAYFYDYFEIQPLGNNAFYLRDPQSGLTTPDDLQAINRLIVAWAQRAKRPVCATCDVHVVNPEDELYRRMLLHDQGYPDANEPTDLSLRTTDEMLAAFAYLGDDQARAVVIDNPQAIADAVEAGLTPFPQGSYPPDIDGAAQAVEELTWSAARGRYGRDGVLPALVQDRIERELKSIIDNGFAVMYYIAHRLVKQSNEDGYQVGSRGSVGSSLVATLCGITEVNPLPPHHVCPSCHHTAFDQTGAVGSGFDLPARACPDCGQPMNRDGQDIPFETFLGFDGDKQPDIDLNFSGIYQPKAHRFIEDMFGPDHTFRAGTISGYAEKNAQAIVRNYFEAQDRFLTRAELLRLSRGLIGVKRTTGQHPGGIVVVPKEREIFDFTPIQHPADRRENGTITTHFDFNAMHDTILKLDILGHDDPTMHKMLGDLTGVDVTAIPIPDPQVMSLFQSTQALGIPDGKAPFASGTLGLPELGTFMARDMIRETRPTRFYDLVQLMGLSHGTDVWKGNAQDLIRSGTCTIEDVIGCRDTIMTDLVYHGLAPKMAFDIMERVRKGRGLTARQETAMRERGVPDWYINSCQKIRYMFPKAHAVAYTLSSLRIAWFKVYHPEAYYCSYFTVRADEFDSTLMCQPPQEISRLRQELRRGFRNRTDREQRQYYILELVEEMQLRGIAFDPIDLHTSDASAFVWVGPGKLLPPLNAIPQISTALARQIVAARQAGPFKTQEDLVMRAGIGPAVLEQLTQAGCLTQIPESSQMDLFDWLP